MPGLSQCRAEQTVLRQMASPCRIVMANELVALFVLETIRPAVTKPLGYLSVFGDRQRAHYRIVLCRLFQTHL